jgi:sugar lactone lactonase YvrE
MLKRIILSSSILGLTLAMAQAPDALANWGTYQYDAQHTGKAPVKGPSIPSIKWQYQAGQQVFTDPNDPNNLWTEGLGFTAGTAEGPDGTIYAPADDGRGYAFDPRNGAIKHIFENVGVCCAPPVVGKDGSIYFSGNGLWAFNPDYSLKFYYPDGGSCCGAITVANDGTIIIGNGILYAFDPANLVFVDPSNPDPLLAKTVVAKWIYNALQADWSVALSPDGLTVYAINTTQLIAINPADLSSSSDPADPNHYAATKWVVDTVNDNETLPVVDASGTIYVAGDQKLISVTPGGIVKNSTQLPGNQLLNLALNGGTIIATAAPVVVDPATNIRIIDQDGDSILIAINPVAGTVLWTAVLAGNGETHINPIIDSTGAIYVNTAQKADGLDYINNLYMFSASGAPVWTYSKGTILSSDTRCPIIGADGTLYTLIDGAIVAFGGTADLSPTIVANPNPVYTNGVLSFVTTIANAGPDKSVATKVKVTLPSGFTSSSNFVLPGNCVLNGTRSLSCELGEILVGSSAPVSVSGVAQSKVGNESITATVMSDTPDPVVTNNSKTLTVPVVAPVTCDLTVTAVGGPTSVTRGTTKYSFTATVKNVGTGSCAASTTGFYFSTDAVIPTGDTLISTSTTNALAAGGSQNITLSTAVATSKIAAGSFYIGACADSTGTVAETNETNNCKATAAKTTVK